MNWKAIIIAVLILGAGITAAYFLAKDKNKRNAEKNKEKPLPPNTAVSPPVTAVSEESK